MKKWIYRSVLVKGDSYLAIDDTSDSDKPIETWTPLSELGADGWELVSIVDERNGNNGNFRAYMKKETGIYLTLTGSKLNLKTDIKIPNSSK